MADTQDLRKGWTATGTLGSGGIAAVAPSWMCMELTGEEITPTFPPGITRTPNFLPIAALADVVEESAAAPKRGRNLLSGVITSRKQGMPCSSELHLSDSCSSPGANC